VKRKLSVLLIILSTALFAGQVVLDEGSNLFEHRTLSNGHTEISFTLDSYNVEEVTKSGTIYKRFSYPNEGDIAIPGMPDFPTITRMYAIPNEGNVRLELSNIQEEVIRDVIVFPRGELQIDGEPVNTDFIMDTDYYTNGDVFPEKKILLGEPAIFRDYRVVTVTVNPFSFDPQKNELRIVRSADLELICSGTDGTNVKTATHKKSRFFAPMYESAIENFADVQQRDEEFQQPCYLFIFPDDGSVATNLGYLTGWKQRKGFEVHTASTAEAGNNASEVQAYIQDAYDTWENPPEFICLVGDASGSLAVPPAISGYGGTDHPYTQLDGTDILGDAIVGRISFSTLTEFQIILNKILQYEMTPYMEETDWYNHVSLVGDPSSSGQSTIFTNLSIKETMQQHSDDFVFSEMYTGGFSTFMNNNIDEGVGYFNYRGYIGMSGWNPGNSYNNGPMMPNAVIITCSTGNFADGTSTTEAFVRQGTTTVPKGAVTAIGTATSSTHTMFNNCVNLGVFHGIFNDGVYNMGGALVRGKLNLYNTYNASSTTQTENFSYWNNLMGDPGMEVWTGIPEYMIVEHDNDVSAGSNYFNINVSDSIGNPLPGAWVTMLGVEDDNVFATGYTNEAGELTLELDPEYGDNSYLTVTAHNFVPYLGEFSVVNSSMFVNVSAITIDDDNGGGSSGNDNGIVNPGETIELRVYLENYGNVTANGVTASISCDDELIIITDDVESYGNIDGGSMGFSSDDFDIVVPGNILGDTEITLEVTITSSNRTQWTDYVVLPVEGPAIAFEAVTADDGGNGILDPGETAEIIIDIMNYGTLPANNIEGVLNCSHFDITINDANGSFGNIEPYGMGDNNGYAFEVTAGTSIISGSFIPFEVTFTNDEGYDNTVVFNMQIGEVDVTDPLGPDGFGYYAYDSGDTSYDLAPVYNWEEIDPSSGGSGTVIPMSDSGDDGDIETVDLPFTFRMYGEEYNEITICSNGWIAPGETEVYSYMNWNIPGPGGPSPMIAVFWDDLKISGGSHVCYLYDAAEHRFIVEWSNMKTDFANDNETFQAILYDPEFHSNSLGDSDILFQYNEINNTSVGSCDGYPRDHGQYSTIGLESPSGVIGLQYTFNNDYPTAAKVLEDELAILFTGQPFGFLSGTVSLLGGTGNVEEVEISAGQYITHPDENGDYIMNLAQGTYEINASLAGFELVIETDVEIIVDENTNLDFSLTYMESPFNLDVTPTNNDVVLTWEFADIRDIREQTGYKVYRDDEEIDMLEDVNTLTYEDLDLANGDYSYFVTALYDGGESEASNVVDVTIDYTDADDDIPAVTSLTGNYPNPFNPTTNISYQLSHPDEIEVVVYNLTGQKVRTLVKSHQKAGYHLVEWNGKDDSGSSVSSGIYFYEMKTDEFSKIKKMILLK
jgi:uncharacterized repeat protein (TIGR01451 family)